MVALTAADRKWMDDIVTDVNDGYSEDPEMTGMQCVFPTISKINRLKFRAVLRAVMTIYARSSRNILWAPCPP